MIPAIISGVVALIAAGLSVYGAKRQLDKQQELFDKNQQNQIDFWNANNIYNDPSNQMERTSEAGLNPFSLAANSGLSSYGSVMQSVPDIPNIGASLGSGLNNAAQSALQTQMMSVQMDKVESETALNNAKVGEVQAETGLKNVLQENNRLLQEGITLDNKQKSFQVETMKDKHNAFMAEIYSRIGVQDSTVRLNDSHALVFKEQKVHFEKLCRALDDTHVLQPWERDLLIMRIASEQALALNRSANASLMNQEFNFNQQANPYRLIQQQFTAGIQKVTYDLNRLDWKFNTQTFGSRRNLILNNITRDTKITSSGLYLTPYISEIFRSMPRTTGYYGQ